MCEGGSVETHNVTFNVDITEPINEGNFMEGTDQLWIGTSINEWTIPGDDPAFEMFEGATDNIYTLTTQVIDGTYYYKYFKIVNGVSSWENGEWVGGPYRAFTVVGVDVTLNDAWVFAEVPNLLDDIIITPNPANGRFYVKVNQILNLQITDITGKKLIEKQIKNNDIIDINNAGIYFMRFWNEKGTGTIKVLVK
jgi:hypothetical protein